MKTPSSVDGVLFCSKVLARGLGPGADVLALLLGFHVVICCVSLTQVANFYRSPGIVAFSVAHIGPAILIAAPFALTAVLTP